jgi:hypothetical protein
MVNLLFSFLFIKFFTSQSSTRDICAIFVYFQNRSFFYYPCKMCHCSRSNETQFRTPITMRLWGYSFRYPLFITFPSNVMNYDPYYSAFTKHVKSSVAHVIIKKAYFYNICLYNSAKWNFAEFLKSFYNIMFIPLFSEFHILFDDSCNSGIEFSLRNLTTFNAFYF